MPLEYSVSESLDDIKPILTDHMEWYDKVQRHIFFPAQVPAENIERLASFHVWFHKAQNKEFVDRPALDQLQTTYYELHELAEELVSNAARSRKPANMEDFKKLATLHKDFCQYIRSYERDTVLEHAGMDALTGLRNWKQLRKDLKLELDRLDRAGKSFTIALVRIDQYPEIIREYSPEEARNYLKIAADLIKKSVRTFDDAYRTQDDQFILCLKQSDISGGISALDRLKELLEERGEVIKIAGRRIPLTMSCCIAEPVPEQNIDELLNNLNDDLANMKTATGAVLEYFEISPLQKYLEDKQ